MRIRLGDIRSKYDGFSRLNHLALQVKDCTFENVEIDMSSVSWFDANMCAPFGALLYKIGRDLNTITLTGIAGPVEAILSKNGFLVNYGRQSRPDTYGTTIQYQRLEPQDDRYFGTYIETHLIGMMAQQMGRVSMSTGLWKKLRESIFEVFSNAAIHSQTRLGVFACGQFFRTKHRLDFTVSDLGIGIRRKVNQRTGLGLTASEAIAWAMKEGNTTKTGPIPGGLGLKLLREFITMNKGRIQIASDTGYWELSGGCVTTKEFAEPFPGTTVNIEINTADKKSCCLASELRPEDVF